MNEHEEESRVDSLSERWQELFWALPSGPMRSKLRALEIDVSRALRLSPSAGEAPVDGSSSVSRGESKA